MKNLTPELIAKAKAAKSVEEIFALAKENGMEITEAEAKTYFAQLNANDAVSDDELNLVAGGSCPNNEEVTYERGEIVLLNFSCPDCGNRVGMFDKADGIGGCFVSCTNCRKPIWFDNTRDGIKKLG